MGTGANIELDDPARDIVPAQPWAAPADPAESTPDRRSIRRATITCLAVAAVSGAIGLDHPGASIGSALLLSVLAIGVVRAIGLRSRARLLIVVSTALFAPWLALRSSAWLLVPDVIALCAVWFVATTGHHGAPAADSAAGYRRRAIHGAIGVLEAPRVAQRCLRTIDDNGWRRALRPALGPGLVGVALAVIVTVTLASGDALFASYLDVGGVFGSVLSRVAGGVVAVVLLVAATGVGVRSERIPATHARRWVTPRSALVTAAPLCVVYLAYVGVQCSTLLLGADYVNDRTGLTFAQYARSGFFQLVAVGVLTFVGLTALRPIARVATGRELRLLRLVGVIATACTVAMVVAAIVKLDLYSDTFGLTMLRVHTTVFAAWLGIALVIAAVSLFRLRGEWVIAAVAATALVGVLAMNVVDPERVVAEHNLTETIDSDEFDIDYLLSLSDDAVPSIVAHFDALDASDQQRVLEQLCAAHRPDRGPLDRNRSVSAAQAALARLC